MYDPEWAADDFVRGSAVYIRPFTFAEPGIGVGISRLPWVIIVTTPVGSYFKPGNSKAVTTKRVRANPGGTGWIKADSNYVTSALAKKEAETAGYMEAVFLDAKEHSYFEEGSSCNIFFVMKDGALVTPSLEDTILPGHHAQKRAPAGKGKGNQQPKSGGCRSQRRFPMRGSVSSRAPRRGSRPSNQSPTRAARRCSVRGPWAR